MRKVGYGTLMRKESYDSLMRKVGYGTLMRKESYDSLMRKSRLWHSHEKRKL